MYNHKLSINVDIWQLTDFIYGLFNDAFNSSKCIASNNKIISELLTEKD